MSPETEGASLVIEANEPVAYTTARPDPLTLLLDFRNVAAADVAGEHVHYLAFHHMFDPDSRERPVLRGELYRRDPDATWAQLMNAWRTHDTKIRRVRDTGEGISPEHLPHIFERFYRVEATRPRFGPSLGSGLGLPIAKSIAEAHGGQIGVSSKVGQGTTFWVELPTSRVETD